MAVWFKGMRRDETVALTLAMRDSGDVLDWSDIGRPIADKHSTGGVGDNVSLMLAPIVASLGLAVPMISGRGLGHTGGTLDKLESIAGYNIMPGEAVFRKTVREVGCAIIGQTGDLAPADKRLYAIRDVTATVDSVPLITASILSKKLAAGLETLVLDVKVGSGAFMTDLEEARTLARSLVEVANGAGVKTSALITDMNEPLADCAGNALEVIHAVEFLKGLKRGSRSETVTLALAAEMLLSAGVVSNAVEGLAKAQEAISSGRALETFGRMVSSLGGPADFVERPWAHMPKAAVELVVEAPQAGMLTSCRAREIGMAVIGLGGGRIVPSDTVDHSVGVTDFLPRHTGGKGRCHRPHPRATKPPPHGRGPSCWQATRLPKADRRRARRSSKGSVLEIEHAVLHLVGLQLAHEAHAHQHAGKRLVLQHEGIDISDTDRADFEAVERDMGGLRRAIGGGDGVAVVEAGCADADALGGLLVDGDEGSAGIDKAFHIASVDPEAGVEMPAGPGLDGLLAGGGDRDRACGRGGSLHIHAGRLGAGDRAFQARVSVAEIDGSHRCRRCYEQKAVHCF